jgi:hypothetical protein
MKVITITKTKLAAANKSKKGEGLVLVENGVLCYIPNRLVALIDSYEIQSVEFSETEQKTPDGGLVLGNLTKVNESKIGENKLIAAELQSTVGVKKLQMELKKLEKEEV